jgi:hypothetical protein
MEEKLALPVGVENFEKIRTKGYYYIDKSGLIVDLLDSKSEVNLITRPRRFGKSLNMGMLKNFFEIGNNPSLFDGLKIKERPDLFEEYMGKFPVISISFKDVNGEVFEDAKKMLIELICEEFSKHKYLLNSDKLDEFDKNNLLIYLKKTKSEMVLQNSLSVLLSLLYKHYGKKVIVLIDEYDVPLNKANQNGYYKEMINIIRTLLSTVLKGNNYLELAVLTGCLRVSKESIFTGLNNLDVSSITDARFCEYFGFTDDEVKKMLDYYNLSENFEIMKQWYDGYRFGNTDVYCPWDVLKHCKALLEDPSVEPEAYWINTGSYDHIRQFLSMADETTKDEIERLINGETLIKTIHQELTYGEIDSSIDNMWSLLFMTGYLTQKGKRQRNQIPLTIPNLEIKEIFVLEIYSWFKSYGKRDTEKLQSFCNSFAIGDSKSAENFFNAYLRETISIRDTNVPIAKKENFYHGILLGLLSLMSTWIVRSNVESGDGYSDIVIKIPSTQIGIVVEVKYGENKDMDSACKQALEQIEKMNYADILIDDGMNTIYKYGIACYKKQCRIVRA